MKPFALFFLLCLLLAGCTNPNKSLRILDDQGYKDIHMTGYRVFGCSDDDSTHDGFSAVSPSGHTITGVVCGTYLTKGSTIRLD